MKRITILHCVQKYVKKGNTLYSIYKKIVLKQMLELEDWKKIAMTTFKTHESQMALDFISVILNKQCQFHNILFTINMLFVKLSTKMYNFNPGKYDSI